MKNWIKSAALLLFSLLLVFSCNIIGQEPEDGITVESVSISNGNTTLTIDGSLQLNAIVLPANAENLNVIWSSSDTSIATVSDTGVVTALTEGTVTITVTTADGGLTASVVLTITEEPESVPFISVWDMSLTTTNTLDFPLVEDGNYDFTIDWGDGTVESYTDSNVSHTYGAAAIYTVTVTGVCEGFGFSSGDSENNEENLIDISQWGSMKLNNEPYKFSNCVNLTGFTASDDPDLDGISDLSYMFYIATAFNGDVSDWDVSGVTNMSSMFAGYTFADGYGSTSIITVFNQNISAWDTSNVTNMSRMFHNAIKFNQDLSSWDTSAVTDMSGMLSGDWMNGKVIFNSGISTWDTSSVNNMDGMFNCNKHFNQDLSNWDTSNVTTMKFMFQDAEAFNGNISSWDTSSLTTMYYMFNNAFAFNQDLSGWDTSNVTNMSTAFAGAISFNGDISRWDTSKVTDMRAMFFYTNAFSSDISGWDTSSVTDMSQMFFSANVFNQDLSAWDTSSVTNMDSMFHSADTFNQDISAWDTSNITNMNSMFYHANSYTNGDNPTGLELWTVEATCHTTSMFFYCPLTPTPSWYTP